MDWFLYDNGLRHEKVKSGIYDDHSQIIVLHISYVIKICTCFIYKKHRDF